jgi:hypothetical protein
MQQGVERGWAFLKACSLQIIPYFGISENMYVKKYAFHLDALGRSFNRQWLISWLILPIRSRRGKGC